MPHLKPFSVSPYRAVHDLVLAYLYISCLTSLPPPSYYSNHGKHQYLCTSCYLLLLLCFLQVKCWTFVLQISINHTLDLICFPLYHQDGSVQFSCSIVSDSLRPHGLQHARPPCPSPNPGIYQNSCPLSQLCHSTMNLLSSPSRPALNLSQHCGPFKWVSSSHQVAKVLEFQLQHQSFQWITRTDFL